MSSDHVPVGYCPHCRSMFIQHNEQPRCTYCGKPLADKYSFPDSDSMHEALSRLRRRAFLRIFLIALPLVIFTVALVYFISDSLLPSVNPSVPAMIVCTPATAWILTQYWRIGVIARFHVNLTSWRKDPKASRAKFTRFLPAIFYTVLIVLAAYCFYQPISGRSLYTPAPTKRITVVTPVASVDTSASDALRRKPSTATPAPTATRLDPQQVLEWYKNLGLDR